MFRIRSDQMQRLSEATQQRFVARMAVHLREHYPEWVEELSDVELGEWLSEALAKAEQYKVTTEPEAAQLILLFVVLGLDADEELQWAAEILSDRELEAPGKVRRLIAAAREHGIPSLEHAVFYEREAS